MTNTFQETLNTGNGTLEYVLIIEGIKYSFATNSRFHLGIVLNGTTPLNGLLRKGINIDYNCDIPNAIIDGSGITFTILEDSNYSIGQVFHRKPSHVTRLRKNITPNSTIIPVDETWDTSENGGYIYIGNETLFIPASGVDSEGLPVFAPDDDGERAYFNSTAKGWFAFAPGVPLNQSTEVTDYPTAFNNRRVFLYAFGSSERTTGTGTLVWTGTIVGEPSLNNAGEWKIHCQSVTEKLKQKLGTNLGDKYKPTGIHHPEDDRFRLFIGEYQVPLIYTDSIVAAIGDFNDYLVASCVVTSSLDWVADKDTWLTHLSESLGVAIVSGSGAGNWTTNPEFKWGTPNGDLRLSWTLTGSRPTSTASNGYVSIVQARTINNHGGGAIADIRTGTAGVRGTVPWEYFGANRRDEHGGEPEFYIEVEERSPVATDTGIIPVPNWAFNVAASGSNRYWDKRFVCVTRDYDGNLCQGFPEVVAPLYVPQMDITSSHRLYLTPIGSVPGLASNITVECPIPNYYWGSREMVFVDGTFNLDITSIDVGGGFITYDASHLGGAGQPIYLTSDDTLTLSAKVVNNGTFVDFLKNITTESPKSSSLGAFPDFTTVDIDIAGTETLFSQSFLSDAGAVDPYYGQRQYLFYQDYSLRDIISEECKMMGWYPVITLSGSNAGKLGFKRHRFRSLVETGSFRISASNAITQGKTGQWWNLNRAVEKPINQIVLRGDLDSLEDKYHVTNNEFYLPAISRYSGKRNVLKIEPKSKEVVQMSSGEWILKTIEMGERIFPNFGFSRDVWEGSVPMTAFDKMQPGDTAIVDLSTLPNSSGTRGGEPQAGQVKGVSWDMNTGIGRVQVILEEASLGVGYSPTAAIITKSLSSGNDYTFTVDSNRYVGASSGLTDTTWFNAGDLVEIRQFDSWTPVRLTGSIASKTSNSITVTFTSPPDDPTLQSIVSGARLGYQAVTASNLPASQSLYTYVYSGSYFGPQGITSLYKNILR